jgi:co-chaperonin GroES (HSP10)
MEEVTESGIILNVGEEWKREQAATVIGKIVAIGRTAWKDFSDGRPWAKVGDRVYYARYSGKTIEEDGKPKYYIVNDEDVQCIINEEQS